MITVRSLLTEYAWRPIAHCPGRWVLADTAAVACLDQLLQSRSDVTRRVVDEAPDPVWILPLSDGGLISFQKKDMSFVHTLGTEDGFNRKLTQLAITLS